MPLELHERARISVGELAEALGETRFSMARWLRAEGCPVHQPGGPRAWRYVFRNELRVYAPFIWRALLEDVADRREGAAGGT